MSPGTFFDMSMAEDLGGLSSPRPASVNYNESIDSGTGHQVHIPLDMNSAQLEVKDVSPFEPLMSEWDIGKIE